MSRSSQMRRGGRKINPAFLLREQCHQQQHALSQADLPPVVGHPLASAAPPTMVDTAGGMDEMLGHLRAAGAFAFDSEFIRERSYEPRLCLVQAATRERVFLVDPLAGLDLSGLWELLVCPTVEKIVLDGGQDFEPAVRRTGKAPANVTDVQIAAGFVHVDYPLSLCRLIGEFAGVALSKGLAFTHWDRRPLSASQVRYAGDDVRYLLAAREALGRRLESAGRSEWARAECAAAVGNVGAYRPDPQSLYLRVRRRDRLGPRQLAVLRELAIVRDRAARCENVPVRTLLKDQILVALAYRPIGKLADLDAVSGLPRPVEMKYGQAIVEATARAMSLPADQLPAAEPIAKPSFSRRVDKILAAITEYCLERSIAPALVASRKAVARACRNGGLNGAFAGWRAELLGELLEQFFCEREAV